MAHQDGLCCGLYRGTFYMRDLSDPNAPLLSVGNAEATITQSMTETTVPNFESLGGNSCSVSYPESVGIDMTLHCTSPDNLARAFLGEALMKDGGTVNEEEHVVNSIGELVPLNHIPDKASIVVEDEVANAYTINEDYAVTNAGIKIVEGSSIPLGSTILVSYT